MFPKFFGRKTADRFLAFIAVYLCCFHYAVAQNYPVQASLVLNAPYSDQFASYATQPDRVSITLLNKDLASNQVEVFLRLSVDGPGFHFETDPTYKKAEPFVLLPGIPTMLSGAEISDLLDAGHLLFDGVSREQFLSSGSRLPQGLYTFKIRAFEYYRGAAVSNEGIFTAHISGLLPPILNLPQDESTIEKLPVQNFLIQFFPRHGMSTLDASQVQYRIRIAEVFPAERNANEVMNSTLVPLYDGFADQTSFVYGPEQPQLEEGKKYAIQVQAIDVTGTHHFENHGFSEVHAFFYGKKCPVPDGLNVGSLSGIYGVFGWQSAPQHQGYVLEFREKNAVHWQQELLFHTGAEIQKFKKNTVYEMRVTGICANSESAPSETIVFQTDTASGAYENWASKGCGKKLPSIDLSNTKSLMLLQAGDSIYAADFKIRVWSCSGSAGQFSGTGTVLLPYTGKIPIPCFFENVQINSDYRLVEGKIQLLRKPLEWSNRTFQNLQNSWSSLYGKNWNQFQKKHYAGNISSVKQTENGQILVSGSTGTQVFSSGKNLEFEDENGNIWFVSAGGKVTKSEGVRITPVEGNAATGEGVPKSLLAGAPKVFFSAVAASGFDTWDLREETAGAQYEKLDCKDTAYYVGWKLLRAGAADSISAFFVPGKSISVHLDSIHFVRSDGTVLKAQRSGTEFRIFVQGRWNLYADAVWAYFNEPGGYGAPRRIWVGKVNLVNVDARKLHVKLVPVNGIGGQASAAKITEELRILLEAQGLEYHVDLTKSLSVPEYNAEIPVQVDRTALGTAYSESLAGFIRALEKRDKWVSQYFGSDTAWMFMLQKAKGSESGYMALNRNYGFLFLNGNTAPAAADIAHETGHGLCALDHVFHTENESGRSKNLMDYSAPFALLNHSQWLQIFDKEKARIQRMELTQKAREGKIIHAKYYTLGELNITQKSGMICFVDPAGYVLGLSVDSIQGLKFSRAYTFDGTKQLTWQSGRCNGTLTGFIYGNKIFNVWGEGNQFFGYTENQKRDPNKGRQYWYKNVPVGTPTVHGGFEVSDCKLLLQKGTYGSVSTSDTLIPRVVLNTAETLQSLDLTTSCYEYFDESALTIPAKKWWAEAQKNSHYAWNISRVKRVVRLIHELGEDYRFFDANNYAEYVKKYQGSAGVPFVSAELPFDSVALFAFENYLRTAVYMLLNQNSFLAGAKDVQKLEATLLTIPTAHFSWFTVQNRMKILRALAGSGLKKVSLSGWLEQGGSEAMANLLLQSTPALQLPEVLDSLVAPVSCNGQPHLLAALCADFDGLDGENYYTFNTWLFRNLVKYHPCPKEFTLKSALESDRMIHFKPGFFWGSILDQTFQTDGKIWLKSRQNFEFYSQIVVCNPYEWIYIKFGDDFELQGLNFKAGGVMRIPAIFALAIFNKEHVDRLWKGGEFALDVGLLAVGVGEWRLAARGGASTWMKTRALIDIGVSSMDLAMSAGLGKKLNELVPGQDFLDHWNTFQLYYGIGAIAETGLGTVVHKMYKNADEVKALRVLDADQEKELEKLLDQLEVTTEVLRNKSLLKLAGKVTKGGPNLLQLEAPVGLFKELIAKNGKHYRAADFWKAETESMEHYLTKDARHYMKYDRSTGRTLFVDAESGSFIGFHLDEHLEFGDDYEKLATAFRSVHGLQGGFRTMKIGSKEIQLSSDKINVILGRFDPTGLPGGDGEIGTKHVMEEMGLLKNYSFANKEYELAPGAVHILNIPDGMCEVCNLKGVDFWDGYNKDFLDMVVHNKDNVNIIFVTDPRKKNLLRNFDFKIGDYSASPTYLAREVKYLRENDVEFGVTLENESFNIFEVDLSGIKFDIDK